MMTKLALLSAIILFLFSQEVESHGTEVRHCLTGTGFLRIFVEHWHNDLGSASDAGSMKILNDATGVETDLLPTGLANNIDPEGGGILPGCAAGTTASLDNTCGGAFLFSPINPVLNDWVYYDFPFTCGDFVSYSLIQGYTQVLQEGCLTLYPTTINPFVGCDNAPSVTPSAIQAVSTTPAPSVSPTATPTVSPTVSPTATPTVSPSVSPTATPTISPSVSPTATPTVSPSDSPSSSPTCTPPSKGKGTLNPNPSKGKGYCKPTTPPNPAPSKGKGTTSPAPTPCQDGPGRFPVNGVTQSCAWVSRKKWRCNTFPEAAGYCKATCGSC